MRRDLKDPTGGPASRRTVLKGLVAGTSALLLPAARVSLGAALPSGGGPKAVVIGAGIAGLSAAYELKRAGFRVSIFEKENFTGGRMRETWMGPLYGFTHAEAILTSNREMLALAAELGIAHELDGREDFFEGLDNGVGVYDVHIEGFDINKIMRVPGLSVETKRQLPLLQADLERIQREVDPCLLATGVAYDDESLGDYYNRVLGKQAGNEVLRYWVEPACAAWGWPPYMTSKIALLSWFAQQNAGFLAPVGGIGVLTRKLNDLLNVQHEVAVQYITPPDSTGRHTIHYLTPELERRTVNPDVIVCATEGKYIGRLVQGLTPKQEQFARSIYLTKTGHVNYILSDKAAPAEQLGGAYIPSHPDPFKRRVAGWSVSPAAPGNNSRPANIAMNLSDAEVLNWQASGKPIHEYCEPLVKHFYPAFSSRDVIDIVNYSCDDLIYMPVGYCRQMADILRDQEKERRGLYFAGEYVSGAHTGAACASGRTIGRLIVKHWME